jgi:HSP20 family protein
MTKKPLKRRKTERPFDDVTELDRFFDEYMNKIEEQMAHLLDDAMQNCGQTRGFVYGFQVSSGADGEPRIEEFGNGLGENEEAEEIKPVPKEIRTQLSEIEPLTDVIDGEKEVRVLAELPGIDKEDIKIDVKPQKVSIKVDTQTRKYHKEIDIPAKVLTDNIRTSLKNGILEIIISKSI